MDELKKNGREDTEDRTDGKKNGSVRSYRMTRRSAGVWLERNAGDLPVIKEDRGEKKKKEKGKEKKTAVRDASVRKAGRLVMALLISVAVLLVLSPIVFLVANRMVITEAVVSGDISFTSDELLEAAGLEKGNSVFSALGRSIPSKVKENLPLIKECSVGIDLPGTVIFTVAEYSEAAFIRSSDGGYYIISENILVIRRQDDPPEDLPEILPARLSRCVVGQYLEFSDETDFAALSETLRAVLDGRLPVTGSVLDCSDRYRISLRLSDGTVVVLGSKKDISVKIETAARVIEEKAAPGSTVDVSISGGAFVAGNSG
ncbi:MAG: FtsQ-type POTRA domain-containing protein [Clostridia bacterium]|nr:FtsQ-type POTRA domain-containing protein [Clostridia bacterium]